MGRGPFFRFQPVECSRYMRNCFNQTYYSQNLRGSYHKFQRIAFSGFLFVRAYAYENPDSATRIEVTSSFFFLLHPSLIIDTHDQFDQN